MVLGLAGFTMATFLMLELTGIEVYRWLATGFLMVLAVVVILPARPSRSAFRAPHSRRCASSPDGDDEMTIARLACATACASTHPCPCTRKTL